ncbi:MAG: DNA mismatch repair endonuclease MutL [Abditibacteriota bacterium]|nr:DNA mismatch repair endonuclease MutL [Abditibacteriota bacterium]
MSEIRVLDIKTVNKIAAGEVVDRPASAVKELVENAIDAGSTKIDIEIEDGGKSLMRVTDNGKGMDAEDIKIALERHATSKIRTVEDLESVHTLGFRGEALPAIASVSAMEIVSCKDESEGAADAVIDRGVIKSVTAAAAPKGTSITVRDIFANVPARLKFLRSAATERSRINDIVGKFVLSYPGIAFRLISGGKVSLSSTGSGDMFDAVSLVMGKEISACLVPVEFEENGVKVTGFVSNRQLARSGTRDQMFFVNGRNVRNKSLGGAVNAAYRDILPFGRYPAAAVFVELPPDRVDVNVHPTKAEVKFLNEREVTSAVYRSVREALLLRGGAAPEIRAEEIVKPEGFSGQVSMETGEIFDIPKQPEVRAYTPEPIEIPATFERPKFRAEGNLASLKIIGQVHNTYIIGEAEDGVLFIDQHVAHERVLYEKLVAEAEKNACAQLLLTPMPLEFSRKEAFALTENLENLARIGFELEPFGDASFVMRSAPASLAPEKAEKVLRETAEDLADDNSENRLFKGDRVIITASCKMAIKAGDSLTMEEMVGLVRQLSLCENPYVCPHGRPIVMGLSGYEMNRRFGR